MPDVIPDFRIFDHQEQITWVLSSGPIEGIWAVRRPLTQTVGRRIEQFVSLNADDVVFHVDAGPLIGTEPGPGDSLLTSTASYTVIFREFQSFGATILAVCRPA